jgi:hypothetical protein
MMHESATNKAKALTAMVLAAMPRVVTRYLVTGIVGNPF